MNLTGKPPLGLKASRQGKDPARLSAIADMPCVICWHWFYRQDSPTQVHHCIHGRHGTKRAPDSMAIPLCEGHHQGLVDTSKVAIHREPRKWREMYGPDTDWIEWTDRKITKGEHT